MPPSFFGDANPHEILSLLSHHPERFDAAVLSISTERDSGKPDIEFHPCATLGDLELLPVELLNEILRQSDLRSVSMLRLLNRRARVIVDASIPYKYILLHAP